MVTNCKNCGAIIDPNLAKCPYCGTRYIDIAIDVNEPFFIRFKKDNIVFEAKGELNSIILNENPNELNSIRMGDNQFIYDATPDVTIEPVIKLLPYEKSGRMIYVYDLDKYINEGEI